jgi:hypothetical protein
LRLTVKSNILGIAVPLPFLGALSRQVSLIWNRQAAAVRAAIAKYARLLPAMFRMEER